MLFSQQIAEATMDPTDFDALTRSLVVPSRRSLLAVLSLLGAALFGAAAEESQATRRHRQRQRRAGDERAAAERRKKKKRKKRRAAPTSPAPTGCTPNCTNKECGGNGCGGVCGQCASGRTCCNNRCVDTQLDKAHCGTCAASCQGDLTCLAGTCRCLVGTACGTRCVDTQSHLEHCGACNTPCAFPHAAASCSGGQCQMGACDPGFADCNGSLGDGCETDTRSDDANCGTCGRNCAQDEVCCGGNCVDLQSDPTHCGTCDRACAAGHSCLNGTCYHPDASLCPATATWCRTSSAFCNACFCGKTTSQTMMCLGDGPNVICAVCATDADCASHGADFVCIPASCSCIQGTACARVCP